MEKRSAGDPNGDPTFVGEISARSASCWPSTPRYSSSGLRQSAGRGDPQLCGVAAIGRETRAKEERPPTTSRVGATEKGARRR
jgi:hypothetical protein